MRFLGDHSIPKILQWGVEWSSDYWLCLQSGWPEDNPWTMRLQQAACARLCAILPKASQPVLFCDHIEANGIVAKQKFGAPPAGDRALVQDPQPEVFAVGGSGEAL